MKNLLINTLILFMVSLNIAHGQTDWKIQTSKNGSKVKSQIVEKKDSKGENQVVMKYIAETSAEINFDELKTFMKDMNNHKLFLQDCEESKLIKRISGDEWIAYLYFDTPWPMPDTDCIHKMKIVKEDDSQLVMTATVIDNDYKKGQNNRFEYYDARYEFTKLSSDKIKLVISASFAPKADAPAWMMENWFPEGPADVLDRLIKNVKQKSHN